jgi:hypothetical protein
VPVRLTNIFDTHALILLKSGQCRLAKGILLECIRRDPRFAPSYLHLALYYQRAFLMSAPSERGRSAVWLTDFCLATCSYLEPHWSAVRRQAEEMRAGLKALEHQRSELTVEQEATGRD